MWFYGWDLIGDLRVGFKEIPLISAALEERTTNFDVRNAQLDERCTSSAAETKLKFTFI